MNIDVSNILEKALKKVINYPKDKIETQEEFEKLLRIISANIYLVFNETDEYKCLSVKELHKLYKLVWKQVWDKLEHHLQ